MDNSKPRTTPPPPDLYACPRCLRVVAGLRLIRYAVGMTDVGPSWACQECLEDLRAQEAAPPSTVDGYVWAVELLPSIKGELVE